MVCIEVKKSDSFIEAVDFATSASIGRYGFEGGELQRLSASDAKRSRDYVRNSFPLAFLVWDDAKLIGYAQGRYMRYQEEDTEEWIEGVHDEAENTLIQMAHMRLRRAGLGGSQVETVILDSVYIAPEYRLSGMGTALINSAALMLRESMPVKIDMVIASAAESYEHDIDISTEVGLPLPKVKGVQENAQRRLLQMLEAAGYKAIDADGVNWVKLTGGM